MQDNEIHLMIEALGAITDFEFYTMSPKDICVYFRRYAKANGKRLLVDHRFLNKLLDDYDANGLDCEMIQENPLIMDFIDYFYEKLHTSQLDIQQKLDSANSMPKVTVFLQKLQNHWNVKKHWNSTLPVKPVNQLTINAIRLEMPQLSGVQLISTEQEALNLEEQILKKYEQYIDFEPVPGTSPENS